jgi:hypothetical protein
VGTLGAARSPLARPTIPPAAGSGATSGLRSPGAPADPGAPRPRASTSIGMVRPAPAPQSLFEPPTSEDIDKALEALQEVPGAAHAAPHAAPALRPTPAAPSIAVVDSQSNEPTRITDVATPSAAVGPEPLVAAPSLPPPAAPSRLSGLRPALGGGSPPAAPNAVIEPEPSDRTDLSLDPGGTASVEPTPPIAPPMTAPVARFTPTGAGGRVSASMAAAVDSESKRLGRTRQSKTPVFAVGIAVAAATTVGALFLLNRAPSGASHGGESAAVAPANPAPIVAAAPAAAAAPTPTAAAAPPAGPAGDKTAAPAPTPAAGEPGKKPEEVQAAAGKTAPAAAAVEPAKPAMAIAEKPAAHVPGRKASRASRRLAAKGAEALAAAAAAAAADSATPPAEKPDQAAPAKVEAAGQAASADDKSAAPPKEDKDKATESAAGGQGQHVLRITSSPSGAEVVVDGASVGKTPYLGNQIDPASPHAITLKKDGYENHEHMIGSSDWSRPHNGVQTLKLSVKLRKAAGGGGGEKSKGADTEAAAAPADTATPAAKKDDKKDEAPASP